MINLNTVNKDKILQQANKSIKVLEDKEKIYGVIVRELEKLDGKKVTKRFATIIEKALVDEFGNGYIYYEKESYFDDRYILRPQVTSITSKWDDDKSLDRIYLKSIDGIYSHESFISSDTWLTNWQDRIGVLKEDVYMIENTDTIDRYNESIKLIKDIESSFKSGLKYNLTGRKVGK